MTKEKIIEKIEEYSLKHYSCDPTIKYEWWELSNTDKTGLADELLSMIEHEKEFLLAQIFVKISRRQVWYKSEIRDLAKEYGVEL